MSSLQLRNLWFSMSFQQQAELNGKLLVQEDYRFIPLNGQGIPGALEK